MLKNDLAQTIRQLCEDVLSEPTPKVLQEKIISHVQSTFPAQWSTLWLTEQKDPGGGKRLRLAAASGVAEKLLAAEAGGPAVFDFGEGLLGETAKSGEISNITTYDEFKRYPYAEKYDALMFGQSDGAGKRRCVLGVPLMLRSPRPVTSTYDSPWRVIGVLELNNVEQSAGHPETFFTPEDVEMVKAYAAVIAVALQKAQLREESNRIGAGLLEVSQSLIAELWDPRNRSPHEIVQRLEQIVQQTARVMSAEACSLWLRSGLELRLAAAYGYSCKKEDVPYYPLERKGGGGEDAQPVHTGDLPDEELYRGVGLMVYVAKTRQCLNLTTADEIRNHFAWNRNNDERMWDAPRGEACYSLVALPLIDPETDDLRGVFKVENKKATFFQMQSFFTPNEDQRLLTILGNSISFSLIVSDRIQRLRRLEKLVGDFRVLYDLDEALFSILTGLTHRDGLEYNRAMIYLVDGDSDKRSRLVCRFAIGEVAADDWQRNLEAMLDQPTLDLDRELRAFRSSREKYRNNPMMVKWNGHVVDIDDVKQSVVARHAAKEFRSAKYVSGELSPRDMLSGFAHGDFVLIPITVDKELLGIIYADYRFTGDRVNQFECSMLDLFAGMSGAIIEASRVPEKLKKEVDEAWKAFSRPTAHRLGTEAGIIHSELALYIKPELDGAKLAPEGTIAVRGEVIRNSLNVIEQAVSRLRFAVKDYQRLAYEQEKAEDFDLCELVETTIKKTTTQLRGIKVLPPQQGERSLLVHTARGGITYVLEELLINAWKEGHPDGNPDALAEKGDKHTVWVRIETRRQEDRAICLVSDNGRGIPPSVMADLFQKPKRGRSGGTGLGLYLCAQILEANGGRIELLTEGQPNGFAGACFKITLPLSPSQLSVGRLSRAKSAPNVLVVEDNPFNRRHLVKVLTDNGFTCELAANEHEAIGRLSATLRAIVADIDLSEAEGTRTGGFALAEKLKDMGRRMPIVLISYDPWGLLSLPPKDSLKFNEILNDHGIVGIMDRNSATFWSELLGALKETTCL